MSRATVSFVSTQVLSSSDGITHDEIKRTDEPTGGGLQVRVSRDEEKLKARETTNLTLYEQLAQNKEDKEVDFEEQLRESRLPKSLDDEEVAFLEEQKELEFSRRRKQVAQQDQDLLEFREARLAFQSSNNGKGAKGGNDGNDGNDKDSKGSGNGSSSSSNVMSHSSARPAPKVIFKRKRRQPVEQSEETSKRTKKDDSTKSVNPSLALLSNYASSSDDE